MKYTVILSLLLLSACGGSNYDQGRDMEIRRAQPGVVDHAVIPKKSR